MPFLSIIVVTWNNENYIEQALSSCIDAEASDYEVIVVHNASTDCTGELIKRSVAGYEHVFRIVENGKNEGLGAARNIGIQHALGEYLIFLDGDDWFESAAIDRLISKLKAQKPDVLLYDYQRVWDTGSKAPNNLSKLLHDQDVSTPERRRKVLPIFAVAWNKAYRKSFVDERQIKFPDGYYEDVTWSYRVMLSASKIYTTPLIAVNYRQREGSILRSTDERHLVLPERYRCLLDHLREDKINLSDYRDVMFELARNHLYSPVVWPRIPEKKRALYLNQSVAVLNQWLKLTGAVDNGWTSKVARLGCPKLYSLAKLLGRLKKQTFGKAGSVKKRACVFLYKYLLCRLPVSSKRAYFESYWGAKTDGNPISLAKELNKRGEYQIFVGVKEGLRVPDNINLRTVRIGSLRYWYVVATSYLLVNDSNLDGHVRKRAGTVHVQAKHGTPLKHMGLDNRGKPLHPMNWEAFAARCRRWDYVISSNPYSSKVWRRGFPYNYKVLELGYPRNDIFFSATPADIQKLKKDVGIPADKKVALYAPTFRDYHKAEAFCSEVTAGDIAAALGDDYVLLLRAHEFAQCESERAVEQSVLDVSAYPSANELCLLADLLITDYSSIMFDYACLKRPIVLFQYDYERYVNERGLYFDVRNGAPGAACSTVEEFLNVLKTKSFMSQCNREKLLSFNAKYCPWDDGKASERILNAIYDE